MERSGPVFGARLVRVIAVVSFAFILFMPVSQGGILLVLFALMALAAAATIMVMGRPPTTPVVFIIWLTLAFGAVGVAVGMRNLGIGNALGVFVGTPLLFLLCVTALGQKSIRALLYTGAVLTVVVGAYIVTYVGGQIGLLPQVIPGAVLEITGTGFGSMGDATSIRFYGLSTLVAAAPMWVTSTLVKRDAMLPPMSLRIAAAVAGVAGALVGGRKAIVLVLLLMPLIVWFVNAATRIRSGPRKFQPSIVVAVTAALSAAVVAFPSILLSSVVGQTWRAVLSFFTGATASSETDQSVRITQAQRLIETWQQSPLVGRGLGAGVKGYARSDLQPWQYELQYQTLLMQTGLVGITILGAIAVVVARAVLRAARLRPDLTPSLVVALAGGLAMLVANTTNPYLQAPAHQWAIFLPLAVVNLMLREPAPTGVAEAPSDLHRAVVRR